jgi:hypothetical protein
MNSNSLLENLITKDYKNVVNEEPHLPVDSLRKSLFYVGGLFKITQTADKKVDVAWL